MTYETMFKSGGNSENMRTTFNALRSFITSALTANYVRTDPTLAIGTSSTSEVKASAFTFNIIGMPYAHAGAETAFTATTHDIADGYTRIFIAEVPATGTIILTPGTAVLNASAAAAPAITAAHAKLGEIKISASGAIFNATTDALSDSHLTVVYTDYDYLTQTAGFALTAT